MTATPERAFILGGWRDPEAGRYPDSSDAIELAAPILQRANHRNSMEAFEDVRYGKYETGRNEKGVFATGLPCGRFGEPTWMETRKALS